MNPLNVCYIYPGISFHLHDPSKILFIVPFLPILVTVSVDNKVTQMRNGAEHCCSTSGHYGHRLHRYEMKNSQWCHIQDIFIRITWINVLAVASVRIFYTNIMCIFSFIVIMPQKSNSSKPIVNIHVFQSKYISEKKNI